MSTFIAEIVTPKTSSFLFHFPDSSLYDMKHHLYSGLALFQRRGESPMSYEECSEAPEDRIQEATDYYPFAEAAYTVLLWNISLSISVYS